MSDKRSETVKLTGRFKAREKKGDLSNLFNTFRKMVNELLEYVHHRGIASFERLKF